MRARPPPGCFAGQSGTAGSPPVFSHCVPGVPVAPCMAAITFLLWPAPCRQMRAAALAALAAVQAGSSVLRQAGAGNMADEASVMLTCTMLSHDLLHPWVLAGGAAGHAAAAVVNLLVS